MTLRIAVFGGTGYLASLIKNQNNIKKNRYIFFSNKNKNYINYLPFKKNLNFFKNFDYALHLAGPNHNQLKKNKNLIIKKNLITSYICDVCLANNMKLIYVSSMQVYKNYGKSNISMNSKINLKNSYSKSHYISERIIIKKFLNKKKMFTILRTGNVFGFKKHENLREIKNNLIHSFCGMALQKKKILIRNANIQRTFIPSQIFVKVVNSVITKKYFKNSIINIVYKNLSLKDIALLIKKRSKLLFDLSLDIIIKKIGKQKKILTYTNSNFRFSPIDKKINLEIDQILKFLKKKLK